MKRPSRKLIIRVLIGVAAIVLLVIGFLPDPVPVQTALVTRGPLQVMVEEEGITRAEDRFVISSPAAGHLRRIGLRVGDTVRMGDVVAELESPQSAILDARTRRELSARLQSAQAAVVRAEAAADRAVSERDRVRRLAEREAATGQMLEQAETEAELMVAAHDAARAERDAIRASLEGGGSGGGVQSVVRSPVEGRILTVHRESAGPVSPGEPLLELGDADRLEVEVDVLSQDAVRIHPGMRVILSDWGGDSDLEGTVSSVAPQGHSEISALGVEERRVPVRVSLAAGSSSVSGLGAGFRVLAQFVLWEGEDVLQVPTSALFRRNGRWAVFVVEGGRATVREIDVGRRGGLAAEITAGLRESERVIVHPANDVEDGVRVAED